TFGDLQKIEQVIATWYREHDRPFVDVTFPEQDVSTGVAEAIVTEFHLGRLRAEGNQWFSSDMLLGQIRLMPGDTIYASRLQEDLAWLNQNPFRQVSVVAEKSDTPGDTDLVLKTQDRMPLRFYVSNDDTGTPVLSLNRWSLGVNWGNAFGLDQQLSYQLTTSDDFWGHPGHATFVSHSVSLVAPLPWRDTLDIFGSYSQAVPLLGPDLGLTGISGQASLRYAIRLPNLRAPLFMAGLAITEDLQFGYDFKTSNNNLSFGGIEVSNVTSEVDQFPLVYDLTVAGDYGLTALSNTFTWSPGGLTARNGDIQFQQQASNPLAKARYFYDTLSIIETTRLPHDASWIMRLTGQAASTNLLPSEELGAGGHDTVRGYDERAASGSAGFLVSQELRTPPFPLLGTQLSPTDQAQLLVFWDYGSVGDARATPDSLSSTKLSSLGIGARYTFGRFVDLRLDYGFQQRPLPGAAHTGGLLQAAVTLSD
ncbi:MAG TPA: ShlB/FhaC/HecB family hemolysin secretion/activation protein, partial [Verrucomicrobiae bacterium]|nr:ShlB/FhaC/HecB family hemolysin secretion/activation protein [Verrucomicrobiae bacterium]